jgi:asparagine synthase (glutamine-hydrolysing)
MCGIVGALALQSSTPPVTAAYIEAMRDAIAHRGPDGAGTWVSPDGRVGLGHRRLAIVDLSDAAAQPMEVEDGKVWVTYNGEIYNHADIRRELEATGRHRFRTDHSDTEVLLRAYLEWGVDCLRRFRGMFAFALWDGRLRKLWLVRDRIGIKPLYYSIHHGRLVFASEIKALLRDPEQPRAVDEEALFHYLSFLTTPGRGTLFAGVRKLAAGCWLSVDAEGRVDERRYWDALDVPVGFDGVSDDTIAEGLIDELRTAVRLHKVGDVPVGVFLSGGIDSSTNAALFAEDSADRVKTFSIGYDSDYGSYKNELSYARDVADRIGAEHHELRLTQKDLVDFLPRMVSLQDEPIADPVCVPVYYVSKLAREAGVVVAQVGEGADELFWGYPNWRRALRLQRLNDGMPLAGIMRRLGLYALDLAGRSGGQASDWLARTSAGRPLFWGGAEAFPHRQKLSLLSERLRQDFGARSSWEAIEPIWRRYQEKRPGRAGLDWMTYLDLNFRLPELLLMRVDKMSMGVSLEGRVPFLDHRFVEYAMKIPESVKTRDGILKYILKKSVRTLIPDAVIDRPKQGFGVPVHEWLLSGLGDYVRDAIDDFMAGTDLLDPRSVRALLAQGGNVNVWNLLNLALWWKTYIR